MDLVWLSDSWNLWTHSNSCNYCLCNCHYKIIWCHLMHIIQTLCLSAKELKLHDHPVKIPETNVYDKNAWNKLFQNNNQLWENHWNCCDAVICAWPWQLEPLVWLLIFSSTWAAMERGFLGVWTCAAPRVKSGKSELIRTHHSVSPSEKFPKKCPSSTFWRSSDVPIEVTLKSVKPDLWSLHVCEFTRWGLRIARLGVCAVRGSSLRVENCQKTCHVRLVRAIFPQITQIAISML